MGKNTFNECEACLCNTLLMNENLVCVKTLLMNEKLVCVKTLLMNENLVCVKHF